METENFDYHAKRLEQRGWEDLVPELKEKMESGDAEFTLLTEGTIEDKSVEFELTFRKHEEHDHFFFNHINTSLIEEGQVVSQASFRESWKLSPEEMYRITAYGSKVAIYMEGIRNKEKEQFNAYLSVDPDQPLDEKGLLNLKLYHDNYYKRYPFELGDALSQLPYQIKELADENIDDIKSQLKRGIPVPVTVEANGQEIEGYLTINAKVGRIDLLDGKLEVMERSGHKDKQELMENSTKHTDQNESAEKVVDEKKKLWPNRQQTMSWNKNKQGKGVSR